jgi:hypothetical protein
MSNRTQSLIRRECSADDELRASLFAPHPLNALQVLKLQKAKEAASAKAAASKKK